MHRSCLTVAVNSTSQTALSGHFQLRTAGWHSGTTALAILFPEKVLKHDVYPSINVVDEVILHSAMLQCNNYILGFTNISIKLLIYNTIYLKIILVRMLNTPISTDF